MYFFPFFLVYKDNIATKRTNRNISTLTYFLHPFLHGLTTLQAISQFSHAQWLSTSREVPTQVQYQSDSQKK